MGSGSSLEVITALSLCVRACADSAGHVTAKTQSQREQPTNQMSFCSLRERERETEHPTDSINLEKKKRGKKVKVSWVTEGILGNEGAFN